MLKRSRAAGPLPASRVALFTVIATGPAGVGNRTRWFKSITAHCLRKLARLREGAGRLVYAGTMRL